MARVVRTDITQIINAVMTTTFTSGTKENIVFKVGDVVNSLRYVENNEIKEVTGRISEIKYYCKKVTSVKNASPVDYFAKDVELTYIIVDSSTEFESKITKVLAREILEFEGITNVESVHVVAHPVVDLDIFYSDETTEHQSLEIGDVLENVTIMGANPGSEDIKGNFKIAAFNYGLSKGKIDIKGAYLVPLETSEYKSNVLVRFTNFISMVEVPTVTVEDTTSLRAIADLLNESDEVSATLDVDVTIPPREDGKITTLMVNVGQTLSVDLNGHDINTEAYAFYVNGGTLNISDSSGEGVITGNRPNAAYPVIYIASDGVCNMEGGTIDVTQMELQEGDENWLYGAVCSGNGIFNMTGGKMKLYNASGVAITNGTASGEGAKFIIGGDAVIEAIDCAGVYLADNKELIIKDNAKILGGIVARMGKITIQDNAYVEGISDENHIFPLGQQITFSGVGGCAAGILALTGIYKSTLGNDMEVIIKDNARVVSTLGKAVEVATINTVIDQKVDVDIAKEKNVRESFRVYPHDELAELAAAEGKTLAAEKFTTDLTIKIDNVVVYPVVNEVPSDENNS